MCVYVIQLYVMGIKVEWTRPSNPAVQELATVLDQQL